jgi:nucleotide-binding universal stress UspA family protein
VTEHPHEDRPLELPDIRTEVRTLLCPVDGSPGSEKGLAYAALVAGLTGAEVLVVVAFNPPVAVRRRGIPATQHARQEMEEDATLVAGEAVQLLTDRGVRARALAVEGEPVEAILETAKGERADLIVMGRRGLGRLKALMVGSVSSRVAEFAEVPVLLTS